MKKQRQRLAIIIALLVALALLAGFVLYKSITQPNPQCLSSHMTPSQPPATLDTARDYFELGNYDYDLGDCDQAIADYTHAIGINPQYAEAYNNRAYTYMMQNDYSPALADLNRAIELRPDYVNALMNRGDIRNYYYAIDRQSAVSDYKKIISLGAKDHSSVCSHLFLAEHDGWNLGTLFDFPKQLISKSCE